MTSHSGYAPDITPQSLLRLISHGTNLLVALSPKQTPMNSLAAEFSLILPPPETPLISHFPRRNHPPSLLSVDVPDRHPILSSGLSPVWFSGIPHAFGSNPYIVPILHAPSESFAADSTDDSGAGALVDASEKAGEGLWAGRSLGVVSGFQTKENSRVLWVGGIEVFSNEYMKKELSKCVPS
jgi:oligosaccharyltransferase complex subunit beta